MTNQTAPCDRMLHQSQSSKMFILSAIWQNHHDTVHQIIWTSAPIIGPPRSAMFTFHITILFRPNLVTDDIIVLQQRRREASLQTSARRLLQLHSRNIGDELAFFSVTESSCLYVLALCACSCIRPVHLQGAPSARLILKLLPTSHRPVYQTVAQRNHLQPHSEHVRPAYVMTNQGRRCFCCVSWSVMKHIRVLLQSNYWLNLHLPEYYRGRQQKGFLYTSSSWSESTELCLTGNISRLLQRRHVTGLKQTRVVIRTNVLLGYVSSLTGLTWIYMELLTYVKNCNVFQDTALQSTGRLLEAVWTFHTSSYLFSRCWGLMSASG